MPGGGFGSKKLIFVYILSVKSEKAFKQSRSERGSDTKTICFISKSERRRARRQTDGRPDGRPAGHCIKELRAQPCYAACENEYNYIWYNMGPLGTGPLGPKGHGPVGPDFTPGFYSRFYTRFHTRFLYQVLYQGPGPAGPPL